MNSLCTLNADQANVGDVAVYDSTGNYSYETLNLCFGELVSFWDKAGYGELKFLVPDFLKANQILFKEVMMQHPFFVALVKKAEEQGCAKPRPRNIWGKWRYVTEIEKKMGYQPRGRVHKWAVDLWLPGAKFRVEINRVIYVVMTQPLYIYIKVDIRDKKRTDESILKERPDYADKYPSLPDISEVKNKYLPDTYCDSIPNKDSKDPAKDFMGKGKKKRKRKLNLNRRKMILLSILR